MTRRPDARASAGQAIEDARDQRVEEMRRRTLDWIEKSRRGNPKDPALLADIVSGIAGGILDSLYVSTDADEDQIRKTWGAFVDAYLEAYAEDRAADAQPIAEAPAALESADE